MNSFDENRQKHTTYKSDKGKHTTDFKINKNQRTEREAMTTVYVTLYALTQGLFTIEAEITEEGYAVQRQGNKTIMILGKIHYTTTREEAIAQAEEMRTKKLKALDNQIKRISQLDFESMV